MTWLERNWYKKWSINYVFMPFSLLMLIISVSRFWMYRLGLLKSIKANVPVIVVGNINVGGTGKTPFVHWLIRFLQKNGFHPGIVSRGYGAKVDQNHPFPRSITNDMAVELSGDEPALLYAKCQCPVVIDPKRSRAVNHLIENHNVDIVISDDGLQHLQMARTVEIVIVDGKTKFGNGWLLPVGPLRELPTRLNYVDLVIQNWGSVEDNVQDLDYRIETKSAYRLTEPTKLLPRGQQVRLVSGIGNPNRFKKSAVDAGYEIHSTYFFADHYQFSLSDFEQFNASDVILMTEKDAVKCRALNLRQQIYVLPIEAQLSSKIVEKLSAIIGRVTNRKIENGI